MGASNEMLETRGADGLHEVMGDPGVATSPQVVVIPKPLIAISPKLEP